MTSLDARGFSITLLKADREMVRLLDTPTKAVGWTPCVDLSVVRGDLAPLQGKEFADHDLDTEVKTGPSRMFTTTIWHENFQLIWSSQLKLTSSRQHWSAV